ncbi:aryl hydrocarbon receptor-like [Cheilinus undulatus]|uniref:aryl hydrocarbon receptor-like n=1 Tax=Cheilinus undulatus TaxID=241271 RepID=UPI001BD3A70B|nr:aryl hydrocarbon receptor-like [Cheilinus undulatus]
MPGNGGVYAVKRRKKPVQKVPKPPPVKTNPSKRHRDRLNVELDRLTAMLPFSEEVRGRLDKLSVLRLSVGYLKVKSFFHAALHKRSVPPVTTNGRNGHGQSVSLDGVSFTEGDLLLQALNGFVLVVTTDGTVFYTSPTIQDFLGFHQSDVVHQSVYDLVHMDDREMFKCQLHFALNPSQTDSDQRAEDGQSSKASSSSMGLLPQYIPPENSSFLERSFCCRLRCLLDNTSGFLALNFNGRLKFLHLQGSTEADGRGAPPPQLALFAIATPVQPPSVMEIRTKTLIFQTKHRMDFAPMGIDTRGKLVLGYSEIELVTTGSGYQFIHAADMMYCADNHLRMIKTGDSGFTFFRLLTKTGHWLWVQANARVVFKGGRPDFIIARQKALTNEEGEEHLRQRRQQLPFNLATGEGVLYDTTLDAFSMPGPPGSDAPSIAEPQTEKPLDPASILGSLRRQDHSVYTQPQNPSPQLPIFNQIEDNNEYEQSSFEQAFLDSHALLSVPGQVQSSQKRTITGDLTSEAMFDSLEQILEDLGDGVIDGLEVEETELRDWENTLVRVNNKREDASTDINRILANDVFSYVEEALRRESSGFLQSSDQTVSSLSNQEQHHGSVWPNNEQPMTDRTCSFAGQNVFSAGGKGASQTGSNRAAPTQCRNSPNRGHTSSLWPASGSSQHCGNQIISTQSFQTVQSQPVMTQQSWPPSVQNNIHKAGSEMTDQRVHYTLNHTGSQQTYVGQPLQSPSAWQQQQLPQHFPHHTLTHSSHTPGSVNSTAQSFRPQMQRLSGSCMYEKREGCIPNAATVPTRQNGPLMGPTRSNGPTHAAGTSTNAPYTLSHPCMAVGDMSQGTVQSAGSNACISAYADVGGINLGHLSGDSTGLGASQSEYPNGNGSLQSSFFCWNGEAQIPNGPLNGVVDPFSFPARPSGNINLSQNSGPQPPLPCPQRL